MQDGNTYIAQQGFTTGEISPEVLARSELDKYQYALKQARNVYIRPYGAVYRRSGTIYHSACKYADKKAILVEFNYSVELSYLLEIGEGYIRVHKDGEYLDIELATPYTESDLPKLRFAQSADVMYITSGKYPVKTLSRYAEDDWRFGDFELTEMYYDVSMSNTVNYDGAEYTSPGNYSFVAKLDGKYEIEIAGAGGGGGGFSRVLGDNATGGSGGRGGYTKITKNLIKNQSYNVVIGSGGAGGRGYSCANDNSYRENPPWAENGKDGGNSSFDDIVATGGKGGTGGKGSPNRVYGTNGANGTPSGSGANGGTTGWKGAENASNGGNGWVRIYYLGNAEITPSGTLENITITANTSIFSENNISNFMKITHEMPSKTVSTTDSTSASVKVGDGWKVITHGTWSGDCFVEKSIDNGGTWEEYRSYSSSDDFNASESGTVDKPCLLRIRCATSGSGCSADLTALPYTHEGTVKITEYISPTQVKADVVTELGSTEATPNFYWGAWSDEFGYPSCVCFFQDRLCFACTTKQPYMLWMSRTGDYGNFGVEKADGTVTDDSAVALSFISRKQFNILHVVPTTDLIVLTDGNEWLVSGASTVTPTEANPKNQTSRGSTDVEPIAIGSKLVFVQRRGKVVRDMGYSFENDQYDGADLTLLAKHLTQKTIITDDAYKQEPDSLIYFVTADGRILCLTYVKDQNVYAWSTLDTDGKFEAVCNIGGAEEDTVYCIVKREIGGEIVRYIESFSPYPDTDVPNDYIMLDCAKSMTVTAREVSGFGWLAGKTVTVLADGREHKDIAVDEEGNLQLPVPATNIVVGLPYQSVIELPNVTIQAQDGSIQGRKKKVSTVYMQLTNSLGGFLGHTENETDEIKYDEFSEYTGVKLFNGIKEMTMPNTPLGGFLEDSSVLIATSSPYPFNLALVVRAVAFD